MTDSHADCEALLGLARALVDELDEIHRRLVQLDRLAGATLDEGDATLLDEPSRRVLLALRGMAEEYTHAHDAARGHAGEVRSGLGKADPTRKS